MKNVTYVIRNISNGKIYVGSSVDSRKRFWEHRKMLRSNTHHSIALQRAWNKYGEDFFKFEVLEVFNTKEEIRNAEQLLLDEHYGKPNCYNTSSDATAPMRNATPEMRKHQADKTREFLAVNPHPRQGYKFTEEELVRAKEQGKNNPKGVDHYRYGKTLSDEVKAKIGDTQRGVKKAPRVYTEEGLAKIRASAAAGNFDHWTGRTHTEESKVKMSKAVVAIDPQGNETVYVSITELRNIMGMRANTINDALKHGNPLTHKLNKYYLWRFRYVV